MNKTRGVFFAALGFMVVMSAAASNGELLNDASATKLRVQLSVEKTQWVLGEVVAVRAVITNLDQARLRIDAFGGLNEVYQGKRKGAYIVSCWNLAWEPEARPPSVHQGKAFLEKSQLVRLEPGGTFKKELSWKLEGVHPGRYQVRLAYTPRVASPSFNFPEHWLRQQEILEPVWMGMIFSEPVEIEVVAPK